MPFPFTCPHCHLKTLVDDAYAGKAGPCAGCGREVKMPNYRVATVTKQIGELTVEAPVGNRGLIIGIRIAFVSVGLMLALLIAFFTVTPALKFATSSRNRGLCLSNMRQIVNALNAYANLHGTYPPPIVYDSAGTPLYSWRVVILPQLGYQELYQQFNKDQPWDSASNILVSRNMPDVFASPGSPDASGLNESNYSLLTGAGTLFPPSGPLSPASIRDGVSQTILVVETENAGLNWTAPGDITVVNGIGIGIRPFVDIGGNHEDGAGVVTADGTAMVLPNDTSPEMIQALITPNGGEAINTQGYQR